MNVHHTLICFFFLSALQDGNTEVTDTQNVFYGDTGRDIRISCTFPSPGQWKIFCKEDCREENLLIFTSSAREKTLRYSTESSYEIRRGSILTVSITNLSSSDSGQYRCGLGGSRSSASYIQFGIFVAEALLDGTSDSQQRHFYKETGSSLTVGCSFTFSGRTKYFCRGECTGDKVLVKTDDVRAQRDRYRIGYEEGSLAGGVLYVTITQLRTSDSGRYRCHLGRFLTDSYRDFEITVTDVHSNPNVSFQPGTSVIPSASAPSSTFHGTTEQTDRSSSTDVLLYVGLTLAVIIILLVVALLIFRKKRSSKPNDTPGEAEDAALTEMDNLYENIRHHGRKRRSTPAEINSACPYAKYTKETGAETSDGDSLVTSATSQHKAEDNLSKLTYAEVNFTKTTFDSPKGISHSNPTEVIYAAPRVNVSSEASHSRDDLL